MQADRNATTLAPPTERDLAGFEARPVRVAPSTVPDEPLFHDPASDAATAPDPAAGDLPCLDGYRIVSKLGEGGMGTVWRAVQLRTRREVALKLLAPGLARSPKAQARFDREIELAARLEHPNLARVYDSGVDRGVCFYAMELIDGQHLDEYVASRRCNRRQVIELMRTVCRAVQHAHQRGVIHRDLKPSNILVTPDGEPHIVDFGLARALLVESMSDLRQISRDGDVAGTPAFMSPEQAAGRVAEVDTRSDVYSLGVILYELLTGQMPHDPSGTTFQVMQRIVEQDVRSPRSLSRAIDRELEALLLKALARDPNRRYASAGELASDLDNYLNGDPLTAKRPTTAYFLLKKLRKNRVALSIVAAALLGVAATLGVMLHRQYSRIVTVPISTNPHGAVIYVNGQQHACGTPCYVKVGPGMHDIRVEHPTGNYHDEHRTIEVAWGVAYYRAIDNLHESEPIQLRRIDGSSATDN